MKPNPWSFNRTRFLLHSFSLHVVFVVGALLGILPAAKALDRGVDPYNLGNGEWIYILSQATNQLGGQVPSVTSVSTMMNYFVTQNIRYVIIKADYPSEASSQVDQSVIDAAHAAGLLIFPYDYSYGTNIAAEIDFAKRFLDMGADGWVLDVETEWESGTMGTNGPAKATQLCTGIKSAYPNRFLAYSTFWLISGHSSLPYEEFGYYCDAAMPQAYWYLAAGGSQRTPQSQVVQMNSEWSNWQTNLSGIWTNSIKPIIPTASTETNNMPADDIGEFIYALKTNTPATWQGYKGVNFWRAGHAGGTGQSAAHWTYIGAATNNLYYTSPATILNRSHNVVLDTQADILWQTDIGADSVVEYGLTAGYGSVASSSALDVNHSVSLTGLTPNTTYHYRVKSTTITGLTTTSGDFTFTTPAAWSVADVIIDNPAAEFVGTWTLGISSTDKFGADYRTAGTVTPTGTPTRTARFQPNLLAQGKYDVYGWWTQSAVGGNRSTNAPYRIFYNGGNSTVRVNQEANGGGFRLLASGLSFVEGTNGFVELGNDTSDASQVVSADAIKLVFVPETVAAPSITAQPVSRTNQAGTVATFTVAATGGNLRYQWQKDGIALTNFGNVSGVSTPTLTIAVQDQNDAATYRVLVTNSAGGIFSSGADLVVNDGTPDVVIVESRTAAGGITPNPPYQEEGTGWNSSTLKSSADPLTGSTTQGSRYTETASRAFVVKPTLAAAGGTYSVEISQGVASSISDTIVATITLTNCTGLPATTTAFQEPGGDTWESIGNLTLNPGVTTPSVRFFHSSGTVGVGSRFYADAVRFRNIGAIPPAITSQPASRTNLAGTTATFTVLGSGTGPLAYQWKKGGVSLNNGGNISGANSRTLTVSNVSASDAANYTVVITNVVGTKTSSAATLTVLLPFYRDADNDTYGNPSIVTNAASAPAGYVANNTDCDDSNNAIHPGATEICDGIDNNCDGQIDEGVKTTFYRDADGDGYGNALITSNACSVPVGYVANNTDCDDGNNAIHPGATEICDGIDNNCDGQIDEGVKTTFYRDADGDGYGNALVTTNACSVPAGYVANNTDCDDSNNAIHPGATEICDGIDNNCDGQIDEGVKTTFYRDADGDGYGNSLITSNACSAPTGYVSNNTDCHDANNTVYPGAPEICDGLDNNCNGQIDEGVTTTFYRDTDGDGYGNPLVTSNACSVPTGYAANNTDCDDSNNAIHPGATEVTDGVDNDCNGQIDENAPIVITTQPIDQTNHVNGSVLFTVAVSGTGPLTYHWRKDGVNLVNGGHISGADTDTLSLTSLTLADAGTYSVIVSNAADFVVSDDADLSVSSDITVPRITTILPKNGISYTDPQVNNYVLNVNGTATDNVRVNQVYISNNDGAYSAATLNLQGPSVTWTGGITVSPGTNVFRAYAVDSGNSTSLVSTVTFYYNVTNGLKIVVNGVGSYTNLNVGGTNLLVGRPYKLTAIPDPTFGNILTNWTATWTGQSTPVILQTNNILLNFTMRSNMVININYITNPFYIYQGLYNGLFHENDAVRLKSAGWFNNAKVSSKMTLSGKIYVDGNLPSFSGKFRIDGSFDTVVKRGKYDKNDLLMHLQLDFANGSQTLTGTLISSSPTNSWTANIVADRMVWQTNLSPANPANIYSNAYTMIIPSGFTNNTSGPVGHSYAAFSVANTGRVRGGGYLSDNGTSAFTLNTWLSKDGYIPVFIEPRTYLRTRIAAATGSQISEYFGFVFGWLQLQTNNLGRMRPAGNLDWIWTGGPETYWQNGFTNQYAVAGSRWLAVPPLLGTTNASATVTNGNVPSAFTARLLVTTNKISALAPLTNKFTASLTLKTGAIKGSFAHPVTLAPTLWFGALLQDYNYGRGFFMNTGKAGSGQIEITAP